MRELVDSRIAELRKLPFSKLSELEAYSATRFKHAGRSVILATWKDGGENRIRIVVQAYRHLFLGVGRMFVGGFSMEKDGQVEELTSRDLYEFT